jgi:Icc-related predicted phosphoesterase
MKLTFISDTHSHHDNLSLESGDILIHCGDVTRNGSLEDAEHFAHFMAAQNFTHKIAITGNHDYCFENEKKEQAEQYLSDHGIIYLNDSGVEIEGIKMWGSPIQPEFHNGAFGRERGDEIKQHWQLIPDDTDVLITHGPAFGILDLCWHGGYVGCKDLLQTVQRIQPKIHACGHIHEAYGIEEQGGTTFVNACSIAIVHARDIERSNPPKNNPPVVLEI